MPQSAAGGGSPLIHSPKKATTLTKRREEQHSKRRVHVAEPTTESLAVDGLNEEKRGSKRSTSATGRRKNMLSESEHLFAVRRAETDESDIIRL